MLLSLSLWHSSDLCAAAGGGGFFQMEGYWDIVLGGGRLGGLWVVLFVGQVNVRLWFASFVCAIVLSPSAWRYILYNAILFMVRL